MNNTFFDLILKTGMAISEFGTGRREQANFATSLKSVAIKSEFYFQGTVEQQFDHEAASDEAGL